MEGFFEVINQFFEFFMSDGETSFWHQMQARIVIWLVYSKIAFIENAWFVTKTLLQELGISSVIESYWNTLDSGLMYYLTLFKVPDAISILFNARVTRFVMDLI